MCGPEFASQVGNGIISFFNDPLRGPKQGRNDHEVEIEFILVSAEIEPGWDSFVVAGTSQWNFDEGGLDCSATRLEHVREGFQLFTGEATNWDPPPGKPQRLVVLNAVVCSASHRYCEILYNEKNDAIDPLDPGEVIALINAVEPALSDFEDPDGDGVVTLLECYNGTDPQDAASVARPFVREGAGGLEFVYQRARKFAGVTAELESSENLALWTPFVPDPGAVQVVELGEVQEVAVRLPEGHESEFMRICLSPNAP